MIPVLQWIERWNHVLRGCRPGGHIMVNCGSSCAREAEGQNVQGMMDRTLQWRRHYGKVCRKKLEYLYCLQSLISIFCVGNFWFLVLQTQHGVEKERRGAFGFWCYKHNMVLKKRQKELLDFGATNTTWC
ncbi:unnamed protein product [Sphagnum troendelagicum]